MAKQVTETAPFSIALTVEHAKQRIWEIVLRCGGWTDDDRSELKTLVEYLEARK